MLTLKKVKELVEHRCTCLLYTSSKATREKCYNHLSGMVYCGCCRRNMTFERRVHGTVKETHYGVFICKRKKNTTPCAYHAVPEKMLMLSLIHS